MSASPNGWIGLVKDQRFAGWISDDALAQVASLDDLDPLPAAARIRPDSTLREALEVILTSRSASAVVEDVDGQFQGLVELEAIRRGLAR
jgi:hypothetical protein